MFLIKTTNSGFPHEFNPEEYLTGTIFQNTNGELYRVYRGHGGKAAFMRMTKKSPMGFVLKAGESRWMPTESCNVTPFGLQYVGGNL